MPAKNPRLTITLKPSISAHLRQISDLTGTSQSALIAEMLEQAEPVLSRMVVVLQAARDAKDQMGAEMVAGLDEAQTQLEAHLGVAMDLFEDGARPILEAAETVKRRAAGAGGPRSRGVAASAERSVPTPMSNRGVRLPPKTPKTTAKSRA